MEKRKTIYIYIYILNIFTLQVWSSDEILDSLAQTGGETLNNSIPVKTKKTFMHTAVGSIKSITYGWGAHEQNPEKQMDNENTDYENDT